MKFLLLKKFGAKLGSRFLALSSLSMLCLSLASCAEDYYGSSGGGAYYPRYASGYASSGYYDAPYYDDYRGGGGVYVSNRYYNRGRYYDRHHDHDHDHHRHYGHNRYNSGHRYHSNSSSNRYRPPSSTPPKPGRNNSNRYDSDNNRYSTRPVADNNRNNREPGRMLNRETPPRPPSSVGSRPSRPDGDDSNRGNRGNDDKEGARKKRG